MTLTKEVLDRPQTVYMLSSAGRKAFQNYLGVLEQIVKTGQG